LLVVLQEENIRYQTLPVHQSTGLCRHDRDVVGRRLQWRGDTRVVGRIHKANIAQPHNTQLAQKEGRIALALQAFKRGQFSSVYATAKAYDIPESTLRGRVNGIDARRDSVPINRKLTPIEESTLIEWILSMDQRGLPVRSDLIRQMANILLQKRSQDNTLTVGKQWVYNFVQRHDSLQSKYTRKYDY
jgi:hypothetical protein